MKVEKVLDSAAGDWLTRSVSWNRDFTLAGSLIFAVALWGGNNAGTKWLVASWPPIFTGGTRFFCAGLILLGVLRCTNALGQYVVLSREMSRALWWRGGLSLAVYIVAFNTALMFTSASHVALYLGAAPVWALCWEAVAERVRIHWGQWLAAGLALLGVAILLWPALRMATGSIGGELLGLAASWLWTHYGRQSRELARTLNGAEVTAHTMWRAGVWLLPLALVEVAWRGITITGTQLAVQSYCVVAGGVVAFALWNRALTHWSASRVLLFNNLIPVSTMIWASCWLGETITPTFLGALALIGLGVGCGQWAARRAPVAATPAVTAPE